MRLHLQTIRHIKWGLVPCLCLALLMIPAVTTLAQTKDIKAGLVAGHPVLFRWVKHLQTTFIPEAEKRLEGTGYTLEFTEYYGGTLAPVGGELEAVEEGLAEIGTVHAVFDAAKLPLQNITYYTPFVSSKTDIILPVLDSLNRDEAILQQAWADNGLEYLGALGVDDYLLMTNFPIHTKDDLRGRKIGAPGPAANWLSGTGAVPIAGNFSTYYNDLKSGVFDGAIVFATAALPAKLYEVAPHITLVGFGAQFTGAIAANKSWFDALQPPIQSALKQAAQTYTTAYEKDLRESAAISLEKMKQNGAIIAPVNSALQSEWIADMSDLTKTWADTLDQQGHPASQLLEQYLDDLLKAGIKPSRSW